MSENEIHAIVVGGFAASCLVAGLVWAAALRSQATSWRDAIERHSIQSFNAFLLLIWVFGVQGLAMAVEIVVPGVPVRAAVQAVPALALLAWAVRAWILRRGHYPSG